MQTLRVSIQINSPRARVWDTMLSAETYRQWAAEFHPGSDYEGSWAKGSAIRFQAANDQGQLEGLSSRIRENIEHQVITIEHLGLITKDGVDSTSAEAQKWVPALETYYFGDHDGRTELRVEVQTPDEYLAMFEELWARALGALQALCEAKT